MEIKKKNFSVKISPYADQKKWQQNYGSKEVVNDHKRPKRKNMTYNLVYGLKYNPKCPKHVKSIMITIEKKKKDAKEVNLKINGTGRRIL